MKNNQEKLKKVAKDGFDLLEEFLTEKSRVNPQHANSTPKSYPYRVSFTTPKTIDRNLAAQMYGGVLILDARRK